jgi:hypothetical protein
MAIEPKNEKSADCLRFQSEFDAYLVDCEADDIVPRKNPELMEIHARLDSGHERHEVMVKAIAAQAAYTPDRRLAKARAITLAGNQRLPVWIPRYQPGFDHPSHEDLFFFPGLVCHLAQTFRYIERHPNAQGDKFRSPRRCRSSRRDDRRRSPLPCPGRRRHG